MSKTVDERVVEMRFDNKQFETNAAASISTLAKLKQSLNLKGASKGLEDINSAAKKVDMNSLGTSVESVSMKFSALQVMGVTALSRITNKAIDAGERIVKALTIDPIKTGFQEYELKMDSVRTIMASTGESVETVNKYLDELNEYSDRTIYSFSDMTSNIGKFTNAGVKLEDAVIAMKGLSNEAAVSGANANEASRAMYNFAQALSMGYVQLIDWKSIENANMATVEFKQQLLDTAVACGTVSKAADDMYVAGEHSYNLQQMFKDGLKDQWLTTDVLLETLKKYGDETTEIGKKAYAAAEDVNTFSKMWDVLKETAQSGWAQTWEIIIGDIEQAKAFITPLTKTFSSIIDRISDARNTLLESALGKGLGELSKKFQNVLEPVKETANSIQGVTSKITELGSVVDDVILGKFGNGQERFDALTKSGYNWCEVQNKINETLGNNYRYTEEQIAAQDKLIGVQKETTNSTERVTSATTKLTDEQKKQIKELAALYEKKEKDANLTKEQIEALDELRKTANKLGIPLNDLIDNLDEINGRWLLLNSIKNVGKAIAKVFTSIGKAWRETFKPMKASTLFNIIAAFHKFTTVLILSDKNAENLKRTFKGLFAILDIVKTFTGGALSIAFRTLSKILGSVHLNVLDFTAAIGDAAVKLRDFLFNNKLIQKGIDFLVTGIESLTDKIAKLFDDIANSEFVKTVKEIFSELFGTNGDTEEQASGIAKAIGTIVEALDELNSGDKVSVFSRIADGMYSLFLMLNTKWTMSLNSGLKILNSLLGLFGTDLTNVIDKIATYISKAAGWVKANTPLINTNQKIAAVIAEVIKKISGLVKAILALEPVQKVIGNIANFFRDIFNVFSKFGGTITTIINDIAVLFTTLQEAFSKKKINSDELGAAIVDGIVNGIRSGASAAASAITELAQIIIDAFCSLLGIQSPSKVFFGFGKNIVEGLIDGIKYLLSTAAEGIQSVGKNIIDNFKKIDIGKYLDKIKEKLENFAEKIKGFDFKKLLALIPIAVVLVFAKKFYDVSKILAGGIESLNGVIKGFASIEKGIANVLNSFAGSFKTKNLQRIAISIAILVGSLIALSKVADRDALYDSVVILGLLAGILYGLAAAMNKLDSASAALEAGKGLKLSGLKSGLIAIGASLLMLAASVKLIGSMKPEESARGFVGLAVMVGAIASVFVAFGALAKLTKGNTGDIANAGLMVLEISAAMLIMVTAVKRISKLTWPDMGKAAVFIAGFTLFVAALVKSTTIWGGQKTAKIGGLLLSISFSLLILVGVVKLIGMLKASDMLKGVVFIGAFLLFIKSLTKAVTLIGNDVGTAKIGGLLLSVSFSLLMLVGVCKLVGMLKPDEMAKGIIFVGAFLLLIKALIKVSTVTSDTQIARVSATIIAFSIAIGVLAAVSIMMGLMSIEGLVKGLTAVTILGLIMTAMIHATKGAQDVKKSLVIMVVAIGVLAVAVSTLSVIEPKRLASATAALGILMGMFALMEKCAPMVSKGAVALIAMAVVVGLLAGVLVAMDKLEVGNAIQNAAAVSILMVTFAVAMKIIGRSKAIGKDAIVGIVTMTVVTAALGGILWGLQALNVQASLKNVVALSALMLMFSVSMKILGETKTVSKDAIKGIGAMVVVTALLGLVLKELDLLKIDVSIETVASLSVLLLAMAGVTVILSHAGVGASAAIDGAVGLIGVVTIIGGFMAAVGALNKLMKGELEDFIDEGIPLLEKVCFGLGSCIGNIISGLGKGLTDGLPAIADNLTSFMTKLNEGTIKQLKNVDEDAVSGGKKLAELMIELTKADFLNAITSWVPGSGMDALCEDMKTFVGSIIDIAGIIKEQGGAISGSGIQSVVSAAEIFTSLYDALPENKGIKTWWSATDLSEFGEDALAFVNCMYDISNAISENGTISTAAVTSVKMAGDVFIPLYDALPENKGIKTWWSETQLSNFGRDAKAFVNCMIDISNALSENGGAISASGVQSVIIAGEMLVELQKALPEEHWFDGKMDLGDFGKKIKVFGEKMADFSGSVAEVNTTKMESIITMADDLRVLTKKLVDLDTSGLGKFESIKSIGTSIKEYADEVTEVDASLISSTISSANRLKNLITGLVGLDNSGIALFDVGSIGDKMKAYADKVADIDPMAVIVSVSAVGTLIDLINRMVGMDSSGVSGFVEALNTLGTASIDGFVNAFSTAGPRVSAAILTMMNSVTTIIITQATMISSAFNTMLTSVVSSILSRSAMFMIAGISLMTALSTGIMAGSSLVSVAISILMTVAFTLIISRQAMFMMAGLALMNGLQAGITTGSAIVIAYVNTFVIKMVVLIRSKQGQFMSAGLQLMTGLSNGIQIGTAGISQSITMVLGRCSASIRSYYSSFYQAGLYLGQGLTAGIAAKETAAYNAGFALGQAAVRGEKDGQKSKSPSKATKQAGKWLGEGLVIGMESMGKAVYITGKTMGENAVDSISGALSGISNISDTGFNVEPTIRPVVDMSELQTGSGNLQIGADISSRLLSGPVTSLQEIVANAQSEINASNNEVIKAINGLREDLVTLYNMDDQEIALYVDSKKLASSIAKPMNRQLNILSKRGAY